MNLAQFKRRRYTEGKTPIEFLPNLTKALGGPEIYIKRDDLLGLAGGGNKTRKLEFLMADALMKKADTIITCGAVQSNHCRLTLAAAVKEGLKCHLVLEERVKDSYHPDANGNNFLFRLLGVEGVTVVPGGSDMMKEMAAVAGKLAESGRTPYIIPGGGSNEIGALGYVSCAMEIMEQLFDMGLPINQIYTSSGSAGTHSGLLAGLIGQNANIPLVGICVNKKKEPQTDAVYALTMKVGEKLGIANEIRREDVVVYDEYVGGGYSIPTASMIEAVQLLARTEAILLDPVYTGKTMAGLIDSVRKGRIGRDEKVLFVHTGGAPALYAYNEVLLGE